MGAAVNPGPIGRPRGVGFGILLFIITLGLYGWYWAFETQEELERRRATASAESIGLVIWILINPVSAFVIPSEIGHCRARRRTAARDGLTGLWLFPFGLSRDPERSSGS